MSIRKIMVGLAGVLVVALIGGILYWVWGSGDDAGSSAQEKPVRVRVIQPQQGGVERTVTRPGMVHAYQFAQLFTKVSGYLQNQEVDIGSRVTDKQLLAEIFAPELKADVRKAESDRKKAKAQVEVMKARLAAAKANLNQAKAKVEQSEADVESARAMVTLRRQEYTRIYNLAQGGRWIRSWSMRSTRRGGPRKPPSSPRTRR
jgi:multidrug efflux pump subunit AcrA (membrane-fusion protein)